MPRLPAGSAVPCPALSHGGPERPRAAVPTLGAPEHPGGMQMAAIPKLPREHECGPRMESHRSRGGRSPPAPAAPTPAPSPQPGAGAQWKLCPAHPSSYAFQGARTTASAGISHVHGTAHGQHLINACRTSEKAEEEIQGQRRAGRTGALSSGAQLRPGPRGRRGQGLPPSRRAPGASGTWSFPFPAFAFPAPDRAPGRARAG